MSDFAWLCIMLVGVSWAAAWASKSCKGKKSYTPPPPYEFPPVYLSGGVPEDQDTVWATDTYTDPTVKLPTVVESPTAKMPTSPSRRKLWRASSTPVSSREKPEQGEY